MAIDPFCSMNVDEATFRSVKRDGGTFYFCDEYLCSKSFDKGESDTAKNDSYGQEDRS